MSSEIVTENRQNKTAAKTKEKPNIAYLREKDRQKVKGIFRNYEAPGFGLSFNFRAYKGDPIERYDLHDGQVYELPLSVARHLNNNCWSPKYEYVDGASDKVQAGISAFAGGKTQRISKKVHRFAFQSLEFLDVDGFETAPNPSQMVVGVEHL